MVSSVGAGGSGGAAISTDAGSSATGADGVQCGTEICANLPSWSPRAETSVGRTAQCVNGHIGVPLIPESSTRSGSIRGLCPLVVALCMTGAGCAGGPESAKARCRSAGHGGGQAGADGAGSGPTANGGGARNVSASGGNGAGLNMSSDAAPDPGDAAGSDSGFGRICRIRSPSRSLRYRRRGRGS